MLRGREQTMSWQRAEDVAVVLCTVPSAEVAERIAKVVVGEGLAACVNIVSGVRSIYAWKGEICDDHELLLLAKTRPECGEALGERIRANHPYENPEVIMLPVTAGLGAYLDWVRVGTAS